MNLMPLQRLQALSFVSYNRQYNRDYRSVMPTNLYGPGDNYNLENSHVVPGLIRRFRS